MEKFKEDRTTMLYFYLQVGRAQVAYKNGRQVSALLFTCKTNIHGRLDDNLG